MIFRGRNVLKRRWGATVSLGAQLIRLTPRSDPYQRLVDFRIEITPEPAGMAQYVDAEGNSVVRAWFAGRTDCVVVQSTFLARTTAAERTDPQLERDADYHLPMVYGECERAALSRYLGGAGPIAGVANYAQDVMEAARGETLRFLNGLNQRLCEEIPVVAREGCDVVSPEETLAHREASSADVAHLFVACARVCGLAARFVSGYRRRGRHEGRAHAWAEAYLPGAGWIGYDPTSGLTTADAHLALAAAPGPAGVAPLSGAVSGGAPDSTTQTTLAIEVTRS